MKERGVGRGSANAQAKLNEDNVREIRSLVGRLPQAEIAARFGVSNSLIQLIKSGKRWAHVQ